jgi:hypothetical protein
MYSKMMDAGIVVFQGYLAHLHVFCTNNNPWTQVLIKALNMGQYCAHIHNLTNDT